MSTLNTFSSAHLADAVWLLPPARDGLLSQLQSEHSESYSNAKATAKPLKMRERRDHNIVIPSRIIREGASLKQDDCLF
jgi:hypothetical protein